jgi:transcriptional regulator with XRE-family HTH domain
MKNEPSSKVVKLAQHLHLCIQARRLTLRWVERQLGMGGGYLGQLLRGNVDLKVKHLLAVLEVIGVEPEEFFSSLYGGTLPVAGPEPAPVGPPRLGFGDLPFRRPGEVVPGVSEERLDRAVEEALLRLGFPPSQESEPGKSHLERSRSTNKRRG